MTRESDPITVRQPSGITTPKRVRADRFKLTDEERALLPDPDWVTEDDADAIVAKRRQACSVIS
jgi:hypothetical protein